MADQNNAPERIKALVDKLRAEASRGPLSSREIFSMTDPIMDVLSRADRAAPTDNTAQKSESHPDDIAVERFAYAMKAKLAKKRSEGRGGWERKDLCSADRLSYLLREHVEKGDPLDVGNLAMMLHQRGERIIAAPPPACQQEAMTDALKLAAARLQRLALEIPSTNPMRDDGFEWAEEALRALEGRKDG